MGRVTLKIAVKGGGRCAHEETRSILLGSAEVGYVLRRSPRRTLALQVDHRGVRVAAPLAINATEVERFILAHGDWLLERLAARATAGPPPFEVGDGVELPVLGERCRIRLVAGARSARWRLAGDGVEELMLPTGPDLHRRLVAALRRRALPWFVERVAEYCYRLERPVPSVSLTSARTRWGSCSARTGIRLHWRLIHLHPSLIDYVVAHEVAHLVEMNHSPRFWAVVERLYPDWRAARVRLRESSRVLPAIGPQAAGLPQE